MLSHLPRPFNSLWITIPAAGVGLVESGLKLLGAESAFLQSAGASRLAMLAAWSSHAAIAAVQGGAVASLQMLLDTGSDAGATKLHSNLHIGVKTAGSKYTCQKRGGGDRRQPMPYVSRVG